VTPSHVLATKMPLLLFFCCYRGVTPSRGTGVPYTAVATGTGRAVTDGGARPVRVNIAGLPGGQRTARLPATRLPRSGPAPVNICSRISLVALLAHSMDHVDITHCTGPLATRGHTYCVYSLFTPRVRRWLSRVRVAVRALPAMTYAFYATVAGDTVPWYAAHGLQHARMRA